MLSWSLPRTAVEMEASEGQEGKGDKPLEKVTWKGEGAREGADFWKTKNMKFMDEDKKKNSGLRELATLSNVSCHP